MLDEVEYIGGRESSLPACYTHMPGYRRSVIAAVDEEIMSFRFARDGLVNRCDERLIALALAQRRS